MKNLVSILTEETQSLKEQYIQFTEEWATEEFDRLKKWLSDYNEFTSTINFASADRSFRRELIKKQSILARIPNSVYKNDVESFVADQVENAKKHYTNSVLKLAARVEKKGLNQEKIKATTSHIGVNIDTTLTDGEKSVRAFTILAVGEINRPHYRYLIK